MIQKIVAHKDKLILLQLASFQVLINFFTNYMIVKKIGFNSELDVYYIAMAVFGFLSSSIGWSISSVLTPILIENREKHIEGYMLVNILTIAIPIFTIAFLTMPFWINFIFQNYIDVISLQKISMIQSIFLVTFLLTSINILFYAIFQEKNQYIKINFFNMLGAIVGLLFVYITIDRYGIYTASLNQLIIQIFLLLVMSSILLPDIKKNLKFEKKYFLLLWNRMKYIFIGSFYYRTNDLVERVITSYLASGFLSLVAFIQRVYGAMITVLNSSISGPTITKFSNFIKEKKFQELKKTLYSYFLMLFIINIFIFLFVLFFGKDMFLYFFYDRIDTSLIYILFNTIISLFVLVFGKTLGMLQRSLLMAAKKEKIVTIINSSIFSFSIILKILLTYEYGAIGLLVSIIINEISILILQQIYIEKVIFNEFNI